MTSKRALWGINLYPDELLENFLEFDSMINVQPSQNNRTRGVEDEATRQQIISVISQRIQR